MGLDLVRVNRKHPIEGDTEVVVDLWTNLSPQREGANNRAPLPVWHVDTPLQPGARRDKAMEDDVTMPVKR